MPILNPIDLAPLAVQELGLAAALSARADQTTAGADGNPLRVEVHTDLPQPLPEALEVAAYRIATEALTNVVRHACASRATIRVQEREGMLEIEVTDDGHGHHWGNGVGTLTMRERAEELGGTTPVPPLEDLGFRQRITDRYFADFALRVGTGQ